ncbi:hypothetical protein Tco_0551290 [Tanacetum coccineum]
MSATPSSSTSSASANSSNFTRLLPEKSMSFKRSMSSTFFSIVSIEDAAALRFRGITTAHQIWLSLEAADFGGALSAIGGYCLGVWGGTVSGPNMSPFLGPAQDNALLTNYDP